VILRAKQLRCSIIYDHYNFQMHSSIEHGRRASITRVTVTSVVSYVEVRKKV